MNRALRCRGAWLLAGALACGGCASGRYHDAYLVLDHLAAARAESRLEKSTAAPSRMPVRYTISGRTNSGDLYLPGEGAPEAAVVLIPGAVPEGKDHERLVELALTLARVRFAVLTPELSGYRDLKIRPDQVREVADAFRYLADDENLSPDGRAGIAAFCGSRSATSRLATLRTTASRSMSSLPTMAGSSLQEHSPGSSERSD